MSKHNIYLDFAAATPVSESVLAAMLPYFAENFYNPLAEYEPAREVRTAINSARQQVAAVLGCKPGEIIFTAGGSEANNLAINGVMSRYPEAEVLISSIEHESVIRIAEQYSHAVATVDNAGLLDIEKLKDKINDKTVLVSVVYANNEIGTIQPVRKISQLLSEIRKTRSGKKESLPLYFHVDASQAANYLDLHVYRLGVDLMTINGGKMYGPKQSGVLYVRAGLELAPIIFGGGQEKGLRSGTHNPAAIIGFATAIQESQEMRHVEGERLLKLRDKCIKKLLEINPNITINGSVKHRLPNNINLTIPGTDNERLQIELDDRGIFVAVGSACSASSTEPSHVLKAIGLSDKDARSTLRISLGRSTVEDHLEALEKALQQLV